jgi:flagellar motor switch protein FliN/FliY
MSDETASADAETETVTESEATTEVGAGDDWGAAMDEQKATETENELPAAEFDQLDTGGAGLVDEEANLDVILDIPVTISMEIGRTNISIRNLLQLNQGSVVELDRLAGEPMDVLVNGTLVAHGEVVVVNEKFGIRLTDVVSPAERVSKLR